MKTWKLFLIVILIAFVAQSNSLSAQTFHRTLSATVDDCVIMCLNRAVFGVINFDVSYHLDKKTGKIDNIRATAKDTELYDSETGERYKYIDNSSDKLGLYWDFWNNPNIWNSGYPFYYNINDGWLNSVMPPLSEMPTEGTLTSVYKLIAPGGIKVTYIANYKIHINAKGEITVDIVKEIADCN